MAEEKETSSSLLAKLPVTESPDIPSEMETNSGSKLSSDDGEKEGEIEGDETAEAAYILDDISEEDDDEDDTNLVVLDPNHVSILMYSFCVMILSNYSH